jgi:hypothetical protein
MGGGNSLKQKRLLYFMKILGKVGLEQEYSFPNLRKLIWLPWTKNENFSSCL